MSADDKKIGIIGGVGPYAGVELARKILENTLAEKDQDYLPTLMISTPGRIEDRTRFLLGKATVNPAHAMFHNFRELEASGASVIGIPCNTAHARPIMDALQKLLGECGSSARLLDMITETAGFLTNECPSVKAVGVLSTLGTWKTGVYPGLLEPRGYRVLALEEQEQKRVHEEALFHPRYGIKVQASPVSMQARQVLLDGVSMLQEQGAEAVILGCTEIPLAVSERRIGSSFIIDPTVALARALIREFSSERLRPWNWEA